MISKATAVLSAYAKWLARNGNKYQRPGCSVGGMEIVSSIREVLDALKCVADIDDMKLIIGLAKAGATSFGNRKSLGCISRMERIVKRMEAKCHQDTESRPQTPQG